MPEIFAYTDGACSGNPGPGGWGVILQAKEDHNIIKERELYGGALETTNNRMELMAAMLIELLKENEFKTQEISHGEDIGLDGKLSAWVIIRANA